MNLDKICWDFGMNEDPPFPQIEISLSSLEYENYRSLYFKIDTGFSGTIGITSQIVRNLKLEPKGSIPIYTAVGIKDTPIYLVKAKCPLAKIPETLLYAIESPRAICGRVFLKNKIWIIDFKDLKFCYVEQ
ncbi:MAG: hypothetical protein ACTSYB_18865 [Candidatus Helarchaeota archaeon]